MSSIAQTQPRTGRRNFTLRAYLAGTAATAALLGAVVLVFASLGAYVAFNGLPIGGDSSDADTASIAVGHTVAAPAQQKARQRVAAGAPERRSSAGDSHQVNQHGSGGTGASGTTVDASPSPATATATPSATSPTVSAGDGGSNTTVSSGQEPTAGDPPSSPTLPTPHVTTPDSIGGTVGQVEQTLHQVGIDVPLTGQGSAVDDVTDSLVGGN
jgi:hypothetical protein